MGTNDQSKAAPNGDTDSIFRPPRLILSITSAELIKYLAACAPIATSRFCDCCPWMPKILDWNSILPAIPSFISCTAGHAASPTGTSATKCAMMAALNCFRFLPSINTSSDPTVPMTALPEFIRACP